MTPVIYIITAVRYGLFNIIRCLSLLFLLVQRPSKSHPETHDCAAAITSSITPVSFPMHRRRGWWWWRQKGLLYGTHYADECNCKGPAYSVCIYLVLLLIPCYISEVCWEYITWPIRALPKWHYLNFPRIEIFYNLL